MTIEDRLKQMLGDKDFAIASLSIALEQAQIEIIRLKKFEPKPDELKTELGDPPE